MPLCGKENGINLYETEEDGLKIPDLCSKVKAMQVMRVKRYFTIENSVCKNISWINFYSRFGKDMILQCGYIMT